MDEREPIAERGDEPRGHDFGAGTEASVEVMAREIFDSLPVGLLFLDFTGKELCRNAVADTILTESPHVAVRDGAPVFSDEDMQRSFLAWRDGQNRKPDTRRPWATSIRPGRKPEFVAATRATDAGLLMSLWVQGRERSLCPAQLRANYNLTSAEARLAEGLANGHSIEDIAGSTGASVHTLRSQLKSVFRKMGVTRQAELVAVLLSDPLLSKL